MEEEIDWEIQDRISKINAQVIANTAALNDAWRNELLTLNLPNGVLNRIWLETSYFGVFLLYKKFILPLGEEKIKDASARLRHAYTFTVPTILFAEQADKEFKEYVASEYDERLEMYKNYNGLDVRLLFRDLIKDVFNTVEGSKVKFIENTFGNRLKLKTALLLGALGGDKEFIDKHSNEVFLPQEHLLEFTNSAVKVFTSVSESDISD